MRAFCLQQSCFIILEYFAPNITINNRNFAVQIYHFQNNINIQLVLNVHEVHFYSFNFDNLVDSDYFNP